MLRGAVEHLRHDAELADVALVGDTIRVLRGNVLRYVLFSDVVDAQLIHEAARAGQPGGNLLIVRTRRQGRFRLRESDPGFRALRDALADSACLRDDRRKALI